MRNILAPGARLVNTSSHLGHLSLINGEAKKSRHLREVLADPNIAEKKLGQLQRIMKSSSVFLDIYIFRSTHDRIPKFGQVWGLGGEWLV